MYNKIKREILTIAIVLNRIFYGLHNRSENFGHWFFNLTLYRGRPGYVEFNIDSDEYDGHIVHRVTHRQYRDEIGAEVNTQVQERMTFRITNRWLVRNGRLPDVDALWAISTDAQTREGLVVVEVVCGKEAHKQVKFRPFDLSRLPAQEVLDRRNARRQRIQNFFSRMFPVSAEAHLHEDMRGFIIKRI